MGDNNQQDIAARLIITIDKKGGLKVEGPINDTILCFGLMEAAKDVIRGYAAQQRAQKKIEIPRLIMPQQRGN